MSIQRGMDKEECGTYIQWNIETEDLTLSSPLSVFMWASHPAASTVLALPHGARLDEEVGEY